MRDYLGMRSKYPKWAHRRDEHKKRRRKSRRKRKRSRSRSRGRAQSAGTASTEGMLVSLLHQLMAPRTLAKKHGENVLTQYGGAVTPDRLANVRSRDEATRMRQARQGPAGGGAGAGAGAAAAIGPRYPMPS